MAKESRTSGSLHSPLIFAPPILSPPASVHGWPVPASPPPPTLTSNRLEGGVEVPLPSPSAPWPADPGRDLDPDDFCDFLLMSAEPFLCHFGMSSDVERKLCRSSEKSPIRTARRTRSERRLNSSFRPIPPLSNSLRCVVRKKIKQMGVRREACENMRRGHTPLNTYTHL